MELIEAPMDGEYESEEDILAREEAERAERLQVLGGRLSKMADDQVRLRSEIEDRWLDDMRQYHGQYSPSDLETIKKAKGSRAFVNITRPKTNAAEARLVDMLFPTDDRNWGMLPTPVPELLDAQNSPAPATTPDGQPLMGPDGQPVPQAAIARQLLEQAKQHAEAMEREVEDQLSEAYYPQVARDVIRDGVLLGTGILKGPIVVGRARKAWQPLQDDVYTLETAEETRPTIERVDPWQFFPDMGATCLDEAEFIFERRYMTRKQLRELAKRPGYLAEQIAEALRAGPNVNVRNDRRHELRTLSGVDTGVSDNLWEVWEYHGPIDKEDLEACGCEVDIDDVLTEYEGVVVFTGAHVLKAYINPLDTEERPYSVWNWETDDSSLFGYGVPYQMRGEQRVLNSSFRAMLDNAALSVGPQAVLDRNAIEPANGDWTLTAKKVWHKVKPGMPLADALTFFNIPNNQADLASLFQLARQLVDEVTGLPQIAQGEQSAVMTKTAEGMGMLMNAANMMIRRAIKNWDDDITRPLLTRFYDWNMQYSSKQEIKGDMQVDARGSTVMVAKEMQVNNLAQILPLALGPAAPMFKDRGRAVLAKFIQGMQISPDDILATPEEIEQMMQQMQQAQAEQGGDPRAQAQMQVAQLRAEADMQKAQLVQQSDMAELQFKAQEAERQRQHEMQVAMVQRDIAMMKLSADQNLSLEDIRAKMQMHDADIQTKRQIEGLRAMNMSREMDLKTRLGSGI